MKQLLLFFSAVAVLQMHAVATQRIQMAFDGRVFKASNGSTDGIAACETSGPACDPKCRKTGICIQLDGDFVFRETSDCGNKYCQPSTPAAICTDTLINCIPNIADHGCDTDGIFPDLYNCHNRIECTKGNIGKSVPICADDVAFDACTGYCDVHLPSKKCEPKPAICDYLGEFGIVPDNDRLYFYCVQDSQNQLHPVIGRCPEGFFDQSSYSCNRSPNAGCINPDASTTTPQTTTPQATTDEVTDEPETTYPTT